ncbi:Uncharacterized protein PCOAH_00020720 [Plasmodium coatneyi]|uniref:Uncharacterized protein n=1 Tax=Plasmodium coatneyi TaxID=208452 RepID=A0A1B1DXZ9_9APIC|nr:Uncharacterized protein PCOAH_00020720 [Plasmodium coatneyi]ANQ07691.1 Uncharacterized protein PCOAH_00020720 [Plasmodium coatneyi]
METKKKGTKLLYCALGALVPVYWFHHRRANRSQSDYNKIGDNVEIMKTLKMNNPLCHIPLIILSIYDGYIYENKMLRKVYYKFRERSSEEVSVPSSPLLQHPHRRGNNATTKGAATQGPNYHFITHSEKSIFNKMYFYEVILDRSVRYAVISPQLSFYILRQLSQHVVNLNTRLYHEKEFTLHRGGHHVDDYTRGDDREGWFSNWVMRLLWGGVWPDEVNSTHYRDDYSDNQTVGEERSTQRTKHLRGNLYEKYDIHRYEDTFSRTKGSGKSPPPQHDQVSINLLYLLNKAYDNVSRICIDTETNLFVNLYMVNILKFICYRNYRHVLMNSSLFAELDRRNRKGRSPFDYFCAFFAGGRVAEKGYLPMDDADRHLFWGEEEGVYERGPTDGSTSDPTSGPMDGEEQMGRRSCTPSNIPSSGGIQRRDDKENVVEQSTNRNSNHHIVEAATSQTIATYNHGGNPRQQEDTKETHPQNYTQYQCRVEEKMKILNDLYLVLYLRLLLECCVTLVSIKKNLLTLEEKVKFEKGNRVFYLSRSDAIENLKVHFLKRFRRGEEKRGFHVFFRPYGNAMRNGQPNKRQDIQPERALRKLPTWHSKDVQPNVEQSSLVTWKSKLRGHSKRAKVYINKKLFHFKKTINYYVINLDEAIKNKYYKRVHQKNVKRIKKHLRENTQKEINLERFHDMYSNMVANLNGILSFAYAVDAKNQAHRILSLYNTCVFYQYNYLNEHDSLFFKNGVSRYLRRLGEWSSSSEGRENDSLEQQSSPSFYYTNDIHLLLLLYTQRIQKCLNVFTYIYNKNHFSKYCSLCYIFHKLNYILFSKKSSSHWIMNVAYLAYHNWFACFSFLYFFCVYSYVAFFLIYQSNTFSSVRYFGIFADPGLSLYFVQLYTNARSLTGA